MLSCQTRNNVKQSCRNFHHKTFNYWWTIIKLFTRIIILLIAWSKQNKMLFHRLKSTRLDCKLNKVLIVWTKTINYIDFSLCRFCVQRIMISALNILNLKQTLTIFLMVVLIKVKHSLIVIVWTNKTDNFFFFSSIYYKQYTTNRYLFTIYFFVTYIHDTFSIEN